MVTLEDVLAIVATQLPRDASTLDSVATFRENDIDSLDLMTIFLAVEEGFEVKFSDPELEAIHSIGELVTAINRKRDA